MYVSCLLAFKPSFYTINRVNVCCFTSLLVLQEVTSSALGVCVHYEMNKGLTLNFTKML